MPTESKYFSKEELACKDGCGDAEMDEKFLRKLDEIRMIVGHPLYLNSAKRCATHNKRVGGKPNSAHLNGLAVDIDAPTSLCRYEIVKAAIRAGIGRIGISSSFVHIDVDNTLPSPVIWLY